jgi:hypothetical protein
MKIFKSENLRYSLHIVKQERRYLITLQRQSEAYSASDTVVLPKGAEEFFVKKVFALIPKEERVKFLLSCLSVEQVNELKKELNRGTSV